MVALPDSWHVLSPLDGRYLKQTKELRTYFSEFALMRYRLEVELKYLHALAEASKKCPKALPMPFELLSSKEKLQKIVHNFDKTAMTRIKEIERRTQHDVKALEYYIKEQLEVLGIGACKEFVHIGLTSQDVNNTAIPMSLRDAQKEVLRPELLRLISCLKKCADDWADVSMLSRTHGQPATPTLLGKEIEVFVVRLEQQLEALDQVPFCAKFGGATGGMHAHYVSYPEIDWQQFAKDFVKALGLERSYPTTQIEHYDHLASFFDAWARIATILMDYAKDMWLYISMDYFSLRAEAEEVGSSTMPHKVNPIDFENAEGNLGIARALWRHFSEKLPISRLQRDLTDSTVMRNFGLSFGYLLLALKNLQKGAEKMSPKSERIQQDLSTHWQVVAEGVQVLLRKLGHPTAYETTKDLLQKSKDLTTFKDAIGVHIQKTFPDTAQREACLRTILALTPNTYAEVVSFCIQRSAGLGDEKQEVK